VIRQEGPGIDSQRLGRDQGAAGGSRPGRGRPGTARGARSPAPSHGAGRRGLPAGYVAGHRGAGRGACVHRTKRSPIMSRPQVYPTTKKRPGPIFPRGSRIGCRSISFPCPSTATTTIWSDESCGFRSLRSDPRIVRRSRRTKEGDGGPGGGGMCCACAPTYASQRICTCWTV
jgi:hypothetical protein